MVNYFVIYVSVYVPLQKRMKRSYPLEDEESSESQSCVKKRRTDLNGTTESSLTTSSSLVVSESVEPKDGIIQEVRITNFMSFTSHKFRLASVCYSYFDNLLLVVLSFTVAYCLFFFTSYLFLDFFCNHVHVQFITQPVLGSNLLLLIVPRDVGILQF